MPNRKTLTRQLHGSREALKQELEPRLQKLEAENKQLKQQLDSLRQTAPGKPDTNAQSQAKASHIVQPSGGGLPPAPDLRAEYERRVAGLRPGDVSGLMEVKREFRKRGLEVY